MVALANAYDFRQQFKHETSFRTSFKFMFKNRKNLESSIPFGFLWQKYDTKSTLETLFDLKLRLSLISCISCFSIPFTERKCMRDIC